MSESREMAKFIYAAIEGKIRAERKKGGQIWTNWKWVDEIEGAIKLWEEIDNHEKDENPLVDSYGVDLARVVRRIENAERGEDSSKTGS